MRAVVDGVEGMTASLAQGSLQRPMDIVEVGMAHAAERNAPLVCHEDGDGTEPDRQERAPEPAARRPPQQGQDAQPVGHERRRVRCPGCEPGDQHGGDGGGLVLSEVAALVDEGSDGFADGRHS